MKSESVKSNADIDISAGNSKKSDPGPDPLKFDISVRDVKRRSGAKPDGVEQGNLGSSGHNAERQERRHQLVILSKDPGIQKQLKRLFETADYPVLAFEHAAEAIEAVRSGADLLLLDTTPKGTAISEFLAGVRNISAAERVPAMFLVGEKAAEHAALDLGARDVISPSWDSGELLARVRMQFSKQQAEQRLRERVRFRIAVVFAAVIMIMGAYVFFMRSARNQTKSLDAAIVQLAGNAPRRNDLVIIARELHEKQNATPLTAQIAELQKQAKDLKSGIAVAEMDSTEIAILQKQLANTDARLKRIVDNADAPEHVIGNDERSVCLLHVTVGFRETKSGRWLRYAGFDPQGDPIRDSDGFPSLTVEGNGPKVHTDLLGTGFLAGPEGRVVTNRHVAEPWWDELGSRRIDGSQPEVSAIQAYFPGDPRVFEAKVLDISKDTDLATIRVDLQDLRPPVLAIDSARGKVVPGESVILMGYATGLDAILARADEASLQEIADTSGGDVSRVLDELARRNLIRPLVTQGHLEDVLPDKILFDAQTTSGGSGGPLFDQEGKVIGVAYAVLRGFAGPSFGIPIRFSQALLSSSRP
jgi:S1-C subfamily serine protease